MKAILICLGVAALGFAVPVQAATPDPQRVAAATRLLDAMHYEDLLDRTVSAMIADQQKSFPERLEAEVGEPLPDDLKAQVFDVIASSIRKAMRDSHDELRRGAALIYASHFTTAELDHLTRIQADPMMVKLQAELPQLSAEAAALGRAAVIREQPDMIEAIKKLFENYKGAHGSKPTS